VALDQLESMAPTHQERRLARRNLGTSPIVMASAERIEPGLNLTVRPDAVYFLMFSGWNHELRSNRWHFAKRWARHVPVILLQPSQIAPWKSLRTRSEPRIPNTRILMLQSSDDESSYEDDTMVQVGQVNEDMKRHGVKRPLLWCYNPSLVGLYAALPAAARVLHATENYFHFDGLSDAFLDFHRTAMRISDLIVAVSDGVASSIRSNLPSGPIAVVTNGCDYEAYSRGTRDLALAGARQNKDRVAIYAGNINSRLDFALLATAVRTYRQTLFAFFGPVRGLTFEDQKAWRALLREENVRYFGPVPADALPNLYHTADVGIIPYKQTQVLVENGFPLKALEMCAAGLPVVSTLMKPIRGLFDALVVTADRESFVAGLAGLSRDALSEAQRRDMRRVCSEHDYDNKFRCVLELLEKRLAETNRPQRYPADEVVERMVESYAEVGTATWRARIKISRWVSAPWRSLLRSRGTKAAAAIRVIGQDRGARRMLWIAIARASAVREAGLFRMMKDLLRLGMLGYQAKYAPASSRALHVTRTYDPAQEQLVFRTVHKGSTTPDASVEDLEVGFREGGSRLKRVTWDHSEAGHSLSLIAGPLRWSVFLGRLGVYEFGAVETLLRQYPAAVTRALLRIGTGVTSPARRRKLSASMDIERGLDERNREFVNELADVTLLHKSGVAEMTAAVLKRLDKASLRRYPDLLRYVPTSGVQGRRVLHLGLGAGALGQALLMHGAHYVGIDEATASVAIMHFRQTHHACSSSIALQGSALAIPFANGSFEYAYLVDAGRASADLARAIQEIGRVLVRGGQATVVIPTLQRRHDTPSSGELKAMFQDFEQVTVKHHGPDTYVKAKR
jgi:ubiquinone/menaquinone biosynthesis C-methylase UbiE